MGEVEKEQEIEEMEMWRVAVKWEVYSRMMEGSGGRGLWWEGRRSGEDGLVRLAGNQDHDRIGEKMNYEKFDLDNHQIGYNLLHDDHTSECHCSGGF
nr:hypothetical protein [Tanacetum cinerariifolium]